MKIHIFKIVLPFSLERYRIAQLYMVSKASVQGSSSSDGVEYLRNEPYTNAEGQSGIYTLKMFHLAKKLPRLLRALVPSKALELEEECHNLFPHTKTVYKSETWSERFHMSVETFVRPDHGEADLLQFLPEEEHDSFTTEVVNPVMPGGGSKGCEEPMTVKPRHLGGESLTPDFISAAGLELEAGEPRETCCAYKIIRIHARVLGQSKIEPFVIDKMRGVFTDTHKQVCCWADEWWSMTLEDIRAFEEEAAARLARGETGVADQ
eukprot:gnl/Dysnectes_brevis/173_a200_7441.p1 GENE.gnl/Dysnectes_brevis/173_a200_7441~~gnl/Dysnectes_brevis/173_a200_7441.p1  ORF type:complete len:264 (+),score=67.20 gnl/Dysnectes_brevis/173_a200_7441:28-819(+)